MRVAGSLLLVEDDTFVRASLSRALKSIGFAVDSASSLRDARSTLVARGFDVVVVDRGLPDGDGAELCAEFANRDGSAAFVILSGRDSEPEVLEGYAAAADLYLRKPMGGQELAAHVTALLKRRPSVRARIGPVTVDAARHQLILPDGRVKRLARQEVTFLMQLADHPGHVVARDALIDAIWGAAEPDSNGLDVLVFRVRRKLRTQSWLIETVRGNGYRLRADSTS